MEINYCYGCMELMEAGQVVCPHCGLDNSKIQNDEGLLHTGTILNGKYLVGRILGRGGFGVTYLGIELILKIKVAIKEYFPNAISSRLFNSKLVNVQNKAVNSERFEKGKEAFQLEAETLAMFNTPGIAHVREYFRENNTAYIVMDFVDGAGLTQEIRRCGGRIPWDRVVGLTLPLIVDLDQLHSKNLTHRDIKPDNIKIVRNRETGEEHMVLLDFGAARTYVSSNLTKTYTQILTPGYAPIEQYQARTHLGPFTDIYALCATMYAAITGYKPAAAPDRMMGDDVLKPFAAYGLTDVPEYVEKAIFHGMEISYKDRPQTMAELYRELFPQPQAGPAEPAIQEPLILPEEKPDAEPPAAEDFSVLPAPKPVNFTGPTATVQENRAFVKKYGKRIAVLLAVLLA
ncbi:MAG: serine/threonine protein kinase, partial [Anaerolineaceae bacterium]|nr:serine/threonine protein kinase [Anaerolineaceae bacterium]